MLLKAASNCKYYKPNIEFLESDDKSLTDSVNDLSTKNMIINNCAIFGSDSGSLHAEAEALYKIFLTNRAAVLKNITHTKQNMQELEIKKAQEQRKAEEEQ